MSDLDPHSPANTSCRVSAYTKSLLLASITNAAVMNTRKPSCVTTEVPTPPALSKACGKFNSPAPKVALTIKKIVPKTPAPKI